MAGAFLPFPICGDNLVGHCLREAGDPLDGGLSSAAVNLADL